MTQDEIIEMARQAGLMADGEMWFSPTYGSGDVHISHLEAFTKLIAEKERERITVVAMNAAEKAVDVAIKLEREACAKICDEFFKGDKNINYSDTIAICIRARAKA
jgi:hypothetical protein